MFLTLQDFFKDIGWDGHVYRQEEAITKNEDGSVTLTLEVPGYRSDNISVTVEGTTLQVRGSRSGGKEEFERAWTISKGTAIDEITAHVEHGMLTIKVPKAKKDVTKIKVSGPLS